MGGERRRTSRWWGDSINVRKVKLLKCKNYTYLCRCCSMGKECYTVLSFTRIGMFRLNFKKQKLQNYENSTVSEAESLSNSRPNRCRDSDSWLWSKTVKLCCAWCSDIEARAKPVNISAAWTMSCGLFFVNTLHIRIPMKWYSSFFSLCFSWNWWHF